jgi:hypothetical protein
MLDLVTNIEGVIQPISKNDKPMKKGVTHFQSGQMLYPY